MSDCKKNKCAQMSSASCSKYDGFIPDWMEVDDMDCVSVNEALEAVIKKVDEMSQAIDMSKFSSSCFQVTDDMNIGQVVKVLAARICKQWPR